MYLNSGFKSLIHGIISLQDVTSCDNIKSMSLGFRISVFSTRLLVGLILYIPVNCYGHVRTVSSPNHTFFLGKLD